MLFRIDYYRLAFYNLNGVESLVKYLNASLTSNTSKDQMQYQVIFCVWLLTFNEQIATVIQNKWVYFQLDSIETTLNKNVLIAQSYDNTSSGRHIERYRERKSQKNYCGFLQSINK